MHLSRKGGHEVIYFEALGLPYNIENTSDSHITYNHEKWQTVYYTQLYL